MAACQCPRLFYHVSENYEEKDAREEADARQGKALRDTNRLPTKGTTRAGKEYRQVRSVREVIRKVW